jgi:hypothetical protein
MVSIPRSDIAKGIFFEYLRIDDPMSTEFRDHVVDGFPFLLSPLSQVKGIQQQMASQSITAASSSMDSSNVNVANNLSNPSFIGRMGDTMNFVQQQIVGATTSAKITITDASSATIKGLVDNTKWLASTAESKRKWLADQVVATPTTIVKIIRNDEETLREITNFRKSIIIEADKSRQWMLDSIVSMPKTIMSTIDASKSIIEHIPFLHSSKSVPNEVNDMSVSDDDNNLVGDDNYTFSSDMEVNDYWLDIDVDEFLMDPLFDEIGGPIHRSVNNDFTSPITTAEYLRQFFVSLGHLYLLLMFIVSFPGSSYSTHESSTSSSLSSVTAKTATGPRTSSASTIGGVCEEKKEKDVQEKMLLDSHSSFDSFSDEDERDISINRTNNSTSKSKTRLSYISPMILSPRSRQSKILLSPFEQQQTKKKKRKKKKNTVTAFTTVDDPSDSSSSLLDGPLLSPNANAKTISSILRTKKPKSVIGRAKQFMLPKLVESNHSQSVDNDHISNESTNNNHSGRIIHCETLGTIRTIHHEHDDDDSPIHFIANDVKTVQQKHQYFQREGTAIF